VSGKVSYAEQVRLIIVTFRVKIAEQVRLIIVTFRVKIALECTTLGSRMTNLTRSHFEVYFTYCHKIRIHNSKYMINPAFDM
jgi:hypothetical protein